MAQNELGGRIAGDLTDPLVVASLRKALTDSGDDLKKVLTDGNKTALVKNISIINDILVKHHLESFNDFFNNKFAFFQFRN